jgi:hypothetical protein
MYGNENEVGSCGGPAGQHRATRNIQVLQDIGDDAANT